MSAYALAARPIAMDLHALLRELDPGRWRADTASAAAEHAATLLAAVSELAAALERRLQSSSPNEQLASLRDRLAEIEVTLRAQISSSAAASRDQWMALRTALLPRYEALRGALSTSEVVVPTLRPTNYRRSLVHVTSGFVALAVINLLPAQWMVLAIAATFFVYAWSAEFLRRRSPALNARIMKFYGPVAHAHEWDRVNSATWYCTALLGLALTGSAVACSIAVLVLGVGDPAAAFVGRRWGSIKLVHGRSLQGSLTFAVVATLVAAAAVFVVFPELGAAKTWAFAGAGAVAGALAELFSARLDDNLTIPVAAGAAVFALSLLLGA